MRRFLHGIVPVRPGKPRDRGITHAVDHLFAVPQVQAPQLFEFVDVVKIGWGLPALFTTATLKARIDRYHRMGVRVSSGGTLTEYAMLRNSLDEYLHELTRAGFDIVEFSESRLRLSSVERRRIVGRARDRRLEVALKVGRKNPREQLSSVELRRGLEEAASLDVWKVVLEAGEGYGVSLFGPDGQLRGDALDMVCSAVEPSRIIFEAPLRPQRGALIFRLGPDVNLGAVPLSEVPALETQRLGVMSGETFGLVMAPATAKGGPAAKFIHFLISTRGPVGQEELIRVSGLPRRTVQTALEKLRSAGLVTEEPDMQDLRRKLYRPVPRA